MLPEQGATAQLRPQVLSCKGWKEDVWGILGAGAGAITARGSHSLVKELWQQRWQVEDAFELRICFAVHAGSPDLHPQSLTLSSKEAAGIWTKRGHSAEVQKPVAHLHAHCNKKGV